MKRKFSIANIMLQPTSLCNMNCEYCYLGNRNRKYHMQSFTAERIALSIQELNIHVQLVWHGGEPLAIGFGAFSRLMEPFENRCRDNQIDYVLQTNATLIDEQWCEYFLLKKFNVGVSIDGPSWANKKRIAWNGDETYHRTMKGINLLREAKIPFMAIAVLSNESLERTQELYDFFVELGCKSVGFNIEECLGAHKTKNNHARIEQFWGEMFHLWRINNGNLVIREIERFIDWARDFQQTHYDSSIFYDIFPCISHNGDVVLLSPEFIGAKSSAYDNFVVGNIHENTLQEILLRGEKAHYVDDYWRGIELCEKKCEHFVHCHGGQAGNKFFELGTLVGTETAYCRHIEMSVARAILRSNTNLSSLLS